MEKKTSSKKKEAGKMEEAPVVSTVAQDGNASGTKKKINLQKPAGTRDFLPDEMYKRNYLSGIIKSQFESSVPRVSIQLSSSEAMKIRSEKIINHIRTDPRTVKKDPVLYAKTGFTTICRFYY